MKLHALVLRNHSGAEWMDSALGFLRRDRRAVGDASYISGLEIILERNKHDGPQAEALYQLGKHLFSSDSDEDKQKGERMLDRLVEEFPTSAQATAAESELFELRFLGIGCEAPDFEAATIDGHEFNLSDYRGKVVLLDFYGFW